MRYSDVFTDITLIRQMLGRYNYDYAEDSNFSLMS